MQQASTEFNETHTGDAVSRRPCNAPLVAVHVITYNGKRHLERCFNSLLKRTQYANYVATLIDNGSTDGSLEYVKERFTQVEVESIWPNAGYAHGANVAIENANKRGAKYIVLCNDDIEFIDARWLAQAVAKMEADEKIGIVVFREAAPGARSCLTDPIQFVEATYLSGFVMAMPMRLFEAVGLFDEAYGSFADEDDLGARARRAGFRLVRIELPIGHFGSGTHQNFPAHTSYLQMRNGIRYCIKQRSPLAVVTRVLRIADVACSPWPFSYDGTDVAHRRMRGSGNIVRNAWLLTSALCWNVCALPQTLRARRQDKLFILKFKERAKMTDEG